MFTVLILCNVNKPLYKSSLGTDQPAKTVWCAAVTLFLRGSDLGNIVCNNAIVLVCFYSTLFDHYCAP